MTRSENSGFRKFSIEYIEIKPLEIRIVIVVPIAEIVISIVNRSDSVIINIIYIVIIG